MFLTVKQVADRLCISPSQVYVLCNTGKLPCHRFGVGRGGAIRVTEEQLAQFIETSKFTPPVALPELRHIRLPDEQRPEGASASR
jgi:excisionase family DNA binding protein